MGRALADRPALNAQVTEARQRTPAPAVAIGGAIDIGSNSVHLLVALTGPGWVEPLRDTSELLGLGDTVDRDGLIPADARARVIEVLRTYVDMAHRSHAQRLTLLGTEPLRRAGNTDTLIAEIAEATGLRLRVLSEREEAVLTFIGVTRGLPPAFPTIVVDIGGGSTEVATWIPGEPLRVTNIALGSARLSASIVEHDPPTSRELDRLWRTAADAVAKSMSPSPGPTSMSRAEAVFVGGTATNVARLGQLTRKALGEDRRRLAKLTVEAITSRYNIKPRRARQLAAGVAIVDAVLEAHGLETAAVSEASLRDGAIIAAAQLGDDWPDRLEELAAP